MSRFYCPTSGRISYHEAGEVASQDGSFWCWENWWTLRCPDCGESHPSLDYAEFAGVHSWQVSADAAAQKRWLSSEPHLTRYPVQRFVRLPLDSLTDADIDASWSAIADTWVASYDERGDRNRRYITDPVLFAFLGDVQGQRVLDAGSGAGYLSRLLAKGGAKVVAVAGR